MISLRGFYNVCHYLHIRWQYFSLIGWRRCLVFVERFEIQSSRLVTAFNDQINLINHRQASAPAHRFRLFSCF